MDPSKGQTMTSSDSEIQANGEERWKSRIVGHSEADPMTLQPHPLNWRGHPLTQAAALSGVLDEIGWVQSVVVNRQTGRLIDGHLRVELAKERGERTVPIVEVDLTEAEEMLILASLDPIAAMAKANAERLKEVLGRVETDSDAVKDLIEDIAHRNRIELLPQEDGSGEPPDPPTETDIERGQIIELGQHRLMCGDSSNPKDVDLLLGGEPIHLVYTDPPYNVQVEPRTNAAINAGLASPLPWTHHQAFDAARKPKNRVGKQKRDKLRPRDRQLVNDWLKPEDFYALLVKWFGNLSRVLSPGRSFYIWGGFSNVDNFPRAAREVGLYFSQAIIWNKEHPNLTRKDFMTNHEWCFYGWQQGEPVIVPKDFPADHEWCFYGWKEGAAHYFAPGKTNATDVWTVKKVNPQSMVHLTEKPVELAVRAIQYSSRVGEHVLDLFGGSGSAMVGADNVGRRAFLMEIDPLYCQVIVDRYKQMQEQV
jgi:DNA modification methylase